jgi:hypothetical protein
VRKFPPFTDADADALVRQLHLAVDNIKIVDELIDILEVGDNFLSDDVTRNGELTVSNDLSLDQDRGRLHHRPGPWLDPQDQDGQVTEPTAQVVAGIAQRGDASWS